jgi:hypothetical protein
MGKARAINMLLLRSKDRSAKYVIALRSFDGKRSVSNYGLATVF